MRRRHRPRRDPVQRMLRADRLRAVHPEHDAVGEPVGAEVHHHREDKRDQQPAGAAQPLAQREQQAAEQTEQQSGLDRIPHAILLYLF